uniref:Ubiquitin carboxyl-terminal hydrolase n=1 Tax=Callorhinchus milii TaxID=7868 RepID=A0A4W3J4T1_CALMI
MYFSWTVTTLSLLDHIFNHIITSVDLIEVKKAVAQNHWSVCSECVRDLKAHDGEPEISPDIWMCLKCGYQGCSRNSEDQHSLKHSQATRSDPHCIVINLESWSIWCYECNEEPAQCNKKALAQALDFLQKHAIKTGLTSKPLKVREEISDGSETIRGKHPVNNVTAPVKGLSNLGNTCFFNAVMQNLAQTHMLSELLNEMKEKETKLKISPPTDSNLDPLMIILPSPGSLTSAMYLFLHSMKEAGKGPVTPRLLFNQLCQKAPWFKGFQQQDSQELLHYLLDALKIEETKRIQSGILKAFNNPTVKTADEETKRKVKVYGKEGVKMNFVDQIFVGELINIIMCEECSHISTVKEPFIDLSLPIIEERVRQILIKGRNRSIDDERSWHASVEQSNEHQEENSNLTLCQPKLEEANNPSQSEGSEKDGNQSDGSNDADGEASECENPSKQVDSLKCNIDSNFNMATINHVLFNGDLVQSKHKDLSYNDSISSAMSKLSLNSIKNENLIIDSVIEEQTDCVSFNIQDTRAGSVISKNPTTAFQTLSQSYVAKPKECSLQSCLHQFTSVDLLMGNNKLLCEKCTEKRQKQQKKAHSAEKKPEPVYTNARKQMLITAVPPVLNLHLKRFHQAGLSLRKVNRHVDFPLVLDLAPFCSSNCKNVGEGNQVLYSLYGIVEHCGSMRGGHYIAYVKYRIPNKKLFERIACSKNNSAQPGQWVYVSDVHVQTVPESRVLNAQAYLLFYERLL